MIWKHGVNLGRTDVSAVRPCSRRGNDGLAWTCDAVSGAEGQVVWVGCRHRYRTNGLVSFLVSFMYAYLDLSPFTTAH
jgi:hypothetical protein